MALERLSGLDSAFLAAERPGNPLHVMGLLILDPTTVPVVLGGQKCVRLYPKSDTEFTLTAVGEDGRTDRGSIQVHVK